MSKYNVVFKLELVTKINNNQLSVDEAAQKYGINAINRSSVRKWVNLYNLYGEAGF